MEILFNISAVFAYLLPIFGVVALIILIIVLIKIDILANKVNKYADEIQPVVTAASNMATTIEAARLTATNFLTKSYQKIIEKLNIIKEVIDSIINKNKQDVTVVQQGEQENGK